MKTVDQIETAASEAVDKLRPQVAEAKKRLESWNESAMAYIKENPGRCLLGALAVGFVIGKIARRA